MSLIFHTISPLLTLTKINVSPDEMSYITKMRNAIQFQIFEDNQHFLVLKYFAFSHNLLCHERQMFMLQALLNRSLTEVVKSHVLVKNFLTFINWKRVCIDGDGFQIRQKAHQQKEQVFRRDEYASKNHYLVATFDKLLWYYFFDDWHTWDTLNRSLFTTNSLERMETESSVIDETLREFTWRRVYGDNNCLFSCLNEDCVIYERENERGIRSVNIFKQIMGREIGELFNHIKILKSIASPFYYILPHQNEREYAVFKEDEDWCYRNRSSSYVVFNFESRLQIGIKNGS
ncbi:uncharacterized protein NPIL_154131 [Nephila pilipes]|uniref:Uncharacterized protein n=1 Tax=Nephila pilipes TaxID=299642 RepID=A0A8X6MKY2_NEPPI|nr:uncharacterized protein NPIL_154131 [Nephila pilipes]